MKTQLVVLLTTVTSFMAWAAPDEAVRAYLGVRAAGVTLTDIKTDMWFVAAIARFEKGKFLGYDRISNGHIPAGLGSSATFEVIWGKKGDTFGYALVYALGSYDFVPDPFFEHLQVFGGDSGTGVPIDVFMRNRPSFRGTSVLVFALSSQPKDAIAFYRSKGDIEEQMKPFDYAVLILLKPCGSLGETTVFMERLRK